MLNSFKEGQRGLPVPKGTGQSLHLPAKDASSQKVQRAAALDLLRACAVTLRDAASDRPGPKPVVDTAKLVARERAWALGEFTGLMNIEECVLALCTDRLAPDQHAHALADVQQALLERPVDVIDAIDGIRGDFLDHFQVHGAKALQAEMLSDALDNIAVAIGWIRDGKPMDSHQRDDLMIELDWLSGREASFIAARDCLAEALGLDADSALAAQQRLLELLPCRLIAVRDARDVGGLSPSDVEDVDVKLLAHCAHLLRRVMVESGHETNVGDNVVGALRLADTGRSVARMRAA